MKSVNPTRQIVLNSIQHKMMYFTGMLWKIGGDVKDPNSSPTYTTDPKTPSDALSRFKSRLMVTVHAGIHPWSTFTNILVRQMMKNQNIKPLRDSVFAGWSSSSSITSSIWSSSSRIFLFFRLSLGGSLDFCELSSSSSFLSDTFENDKMLWVFKWCWEAVVCSLYVTAEPVLLCFAYMGLYTLGAFIRSDP